MSLDLVVEIRALEDKLAEEEAACGALVDRLPKTGDPWVVDRPLARRTLAAAVRAHETELELKVARDRLEQRSEVRNTPTA